MMLPCRVCGVPPETRRQSRSDARIAQRQRRSTIRAGTTASIATRCASITASTTPTIASASLFNTPLGALQSVLLGHNEQRSAELTEYPCGISLKYSYAPESQIDCAPSRAYPAPAALRQLSRELP